MLLVGTTNPSLFYMKNQNFRLAGYCGADYAGDRIEQKTISSGCHYIGPCLISLACKKRNSITLSTTKVEYVSAASC